MGKAIGPILENRWADIPKHVASNDSGYSCDENDYDIIVTIDASKRGFAALFTDTKTGVQWTNAVTEMAIYLGNRGYAGSKIAIITDHLALVAAQLNPRTLFGGFSGRTT